MLVVIAPKQEERRLPRPYPTCPTAILPAAASAAPLPPRISPRAPPPSASVLRP